MRYATSDMVSDHWRDWLSEPLIDPFTGAPPSNPNRRRTGLKKREGEGPTRGSDSQTLTRGTQTNSLELAGKELQKGVLLQKHNTTIYFLISLLGESRDSLYTAISLSLKTVTARKECRRHWSTKPVIWWPLNYLHVFERNSSIQTKRNWTLSFICWSLPVWWYQRAASSVVHCHQLYKKATQNSLDHCTEVLYRT